MFDSVVTDFSSEGALGVFLGVSSNIQSTYPHVAYPTTPTDMAIHEVAECGLWICNDASELQYVCSLSVIDPRRQIATAASGQSVADS